MREKPSCPCGASLADRLRSDARFCSSACRQRAYRRRVTDRGVTLTPEEDAALGAKLADALMNMHRIKDGTSSVTNIAVTGGEKAS